MFKRRALRALSETTNAPSLKKVQLLTPNKVSADIKKGLGGVSAGKYQPKLGNVRFGVNTSKINAYTVFVSPALESARGMSPTEVADHWAKVLDVLVKAGYTLIANVMDPDTRIVGGLDAYRDAVQTQVVAVVKHVIHSTEQTLLLKNRVSQMMRLAGVEDDAESFQVALEGVGALKKLVSP